MYKQENNILQKNRIQTNETTSILEYLKALI